MLVDLRYRQVRHGESVTELPQRMFDLLQLFLAEPHALHTRSELFERVWGDLVVEDANLSQSVWMLRKALGAPRHAWVRTRATSSQTELPADERRRRRTKHPRRPCVQRIRQRNHGAGASPRGRPR